MCCSVLQCVASSFMSANEPVILIAFVAFCSLKVEYLLKPDSGYPKDFFLALFLLVSHNCTFFFLNQRFQFN